MRPAGHPRMACPSSPPARAALAAVVLVLVGITLILGRDWLRVVGPTRLLMRHVAVAFLATILAGYLLIMAAAALGAVILAGVIGRCRQRGEREPEAWLRPKAARWLLLCGSVVLGSVMAEAAAAAWLAWIHRMPALPARFVEPERPTNEIGITVIGESSALGVPYEGWLSLGEIVGRELARAIPSRRFRVEILAEKGATLETMHLKLAGLTRRPDVLIVYSGHNEFLARFSPSNRVAYYDDERVLSRGRSWLKRAQGVSAVCRLVAENLEKQRVGIIPTRSLGAMEVVVGRPSCTSAEAGVVVADVHRRLEAIVTGCQQIGCLPVVIIPPGNDAADPSQSYADSRTGIAARRVLYRRLTEIRLLEDRNSSLAIAAYREVLAEQPVLAQAHYRLARLLESAGSFSEASRHFVLARDHDGLPMRCTTALESAFRSVARRYESSLVLVDGPAVLRARSRHGILDDRLFHDNVHPNLRGYLALAEAVLGGLKDRGAFGWPASTPVPVLDPQRCAAEFGVDSTAWALVCKRSAAHYGQLAFLSIDPAERIERRDSYAMAAQRIEAGTPPEDAAIPGWGGGE
jgi:hypothetical protein